MFKHWSKQKMFAQRARWYYNVKTDWALWSNLDYIKSIAHNDKRYNPWLSLILSMMSTGIFLDVSLAA